ncbi:AAA family ATPase [Azospirillum argentinense]|uniref:AAA family ATPase n=1 Tax=Azospirillum argentinense TaxID=2970906 RepID=UPI001B3BB004|nr:AAA family ATPase [Azospirillum argentinense]
MTTAGESLKHHREARGLTQAQFAEHLNAALHRSYDRQRISRWEGGREPVPKIVSTFLSSGATELATNGQGATVLAVANQKGGVGKTTTAVNVSWLLANEGYRVLLIDADPQGNATVHLGIDGMKQEKAGTTLYQVLRLEKNVEDVAQTVGELPLHVVPATITLGEAEIELLTVPYGTMRLKASLNKEHPDVNVSARYDFIVIDCPPNRGPLTIAALTAAQYVIIPCQTEMLALVGVPQLLTTITQVRRSVNPHLTVFGVLPTMHSQTLQDSESLRLLREQFGEHTRIFSPISRSTVFARAVFEGRSAFEHEPKIVGGDGYREIVGSLIELRQPPAIGGAHAAA